MINAEAAPVLPHRTGPRPLVCPDSRDRALGAEPRLVLEVDPHLIAGMIGGDGLDRLDDNLLEELLHFGIGVLVVGPWLDFPTGARSGRSGRLCVCPCPKARTPFLNTLQSLSGQRVVVGTRLDNVTAAKVSDATIAPLAGDFAQLNFP